MDTTRHGKRFRDQPIRSRSAIQVAIGRSLARRPLSEKYIIHDADTKFTRDFRQMLRSEGIKPVRIGPRRPNQNAVAERFVRTVKEECLDRFLVFGEDHLRYLITQFVDYYHTKRSHRGLDYRTPHQAEIGDEAEPLETLSIADLRLRESLGGALKWYERKAA